MLVRPITTKPAARNRATAGASASAGAESSSAREPARVTCPLMSKRSLIETGMPANGDGAALTLRSWSIASAARSRHPCRREGRSAHPRPPDRRSWRGIPPPAYARWYARHRDRWQVWQVSDVPAWLSLPLPLASLIVRSEPEVERRTRRFTVTRTISDAPLAYKRSRVQECSYAKHAGPLTGDSQLSHQDRNSGAWHRGRICRNG